MRHAHFASVVFASMVLAATVSSAYAQDPPVRPVVDETSKPVADGALAGARALPAPSQTKVLVHIESDGVEVSLLLDSGHGWERVCSTPCDTWLPTDAQYKVAGSNVRQSSPFALRGRNGDRDVLSVGTDHSLAILSVAATAIGATSFLVGTVGAFYAFDLAVVQEGDGSMSSGPFAALIVAGLAATVAGIVGIALTSSTPVSQDVDEAGKATAPRSDAWSRLPTWNDSPAFAREANGAPGAMAPIFSGSF